jgi:hypothetical protein
VIRTLVIERPDGEDFRQIAGYIWDPETQQWELLSCWRIQALSRGLGGGCGFVEDFCRNVESKKHERRATFGPAWRWDGKAWSPATEFRFTKDGNPNMEINCRLNPELGYYSLATGGIVSVKFTNAVPANATLNINSKGAKAIYYRGSAITANIIKAGDIATFIYSSRYHLISIDRWQKDIESKQATITGAATTITTSNLTGSRALVSNSSGKIAASDITSTELGYLDGVTSNIQT